MIIRKGIVIVDARIKVVACNSVDFILDDCRRWQWLYAQTREGKFDVNQVDLEIGGEMQLDREAELDH